MNICTIIAKNYVAHARVLAQSYREHYPQGRCFVLFVDDIDGYIDAEQEPFEALTLSDLPLAEEDSADMRGRYDVLEFSTSVKPWLLELMLERFDDGSGVCYFDPDIRICSRMPELEALLQNHSVVLTPHLTEPMPRDGSKPDEQALMVAGIYNLGFIGLSAREGSSFLLEWWQERLRKDCVSDPANGLFVDQKWMDFAPSLVADLALLRVPSYNVAYWNMATRPLERADDGVLVAGHPLRFLHFSGYDPTRPRKLSKHQDRIILGVDPLLQELCDAYGADLLANGYEDVRVWPYTHKVLPNGLELNSWIQKLYRVAADDDALSDPPFTRQGADDFLAWLNEPERGKLSRYLEQVWKERKDVARAYPDPGGADYDGFIGWCWVYGRKETGLQECLLPDPADPRLREMTPPEPAVTGGKGDRAITLTTDEVPPVSSGVNVAGYLRAELGIGEVARQLTRAFDAGGIPTAPVTLHAPNSRQGHPFAAANHGENPFATNVVFVNADGFPKLVEEVGEQFFHGRRTIAYWWWELAEFPETFTDAFEYVDEIWAGSTFVADAISKVSPVPVSYVPVPIDFVPPPRLVPGEIGWPDAFTFLFSWDYNSVFVRKNPLGVVEAYRQAFDEDDGAALVLKSINHQRYPVEHAQLVQAIGGRSDIVLMDEYLSSHDKDRLTVSCDCYVSLHRSEGLGLTIGEAMYLGKPVVATNYSGSTDFMTEENSYPVDYDLVPVGPDADPYPEDGTWAEPNLEHAAQQMRRVFDDRDEADRRSARAAEETRERFSPEAVSRLVERRLGSLERRVASTVASAQRARVEHATEPLSTLVGRQAQPQQPAQFGKFGGAARRMLLRAMRPYASYQHKVNTEVVEQLGRLRTDVEQIVGRVHVREAENHAVLLAELRRHDEALLRQRLATERFVAGDVSAAEFVSDAPVADEAESR